MRDSKARLLAFELTNQYVFHGSPRGDLEALEPRQGTHVTDLDSPSESSILDGRPAVSATPYADFAIFRAVINGTNVPFDHFGGFGVTDGELEFHVSSEKVLDAAIGKKGYVYVLGREHFVPYRRESDGTPAPVRSMEAALAPVEGSMEWRCYESVAPMEVVEVTSDDLPPREKIKAAGGGPCPTG